MGKELHLLTHQSLHIDFHKPCVGQDGRVTAALVGQQNPLIGHQHRCECLELLLDRCRIKSNTVIAKKVDEGLHRADFLHVGHRLIGVILLGQHDSFVVGQFGHGAPKHLGVETVLQHKDIYYSTNKVNRLFVQSTLVPKLQFHIPIKGPRCFHRKGLDLVVGDAQIIAALRTNTLAILEEQPLVGHVLLVSAPSSCHLVGQLDALVGM